MAFKLDNKVVVILGQISFLDFDNDGEFKAIIHKIDTVKYAENVDAAEQLGEESLENYESYLVPASYGGKIDLTELEF